MNNHAVLVELLIVLQLPSKAAFGSGACYACAYHFGHHFGLVLVRGYAIYGTIVAALWTTNFHKRHGGVEYMRFI